MRQICRHLHGEIRTKTPFCVCASYKCQWQKVKSLSLIRKQKTEMMAVSQYEVTVI